jgi:hypothetical protein
VFAGRLLLTVAKFMSMHVPYALCGLDPLMVAMLTGPFHKLLECVWFMT